MSIPRKKRGLIYQQLPEKLQDFFTSRELTKHLKKLGDQFDLSNEDSSCLGEEVGLIILGITDLQNLEDCLKDKIDVHNQAVEKIATSVENQFPKNIRSEINSLPEPEMLLNQNKKFGSKQSDTTSVPPPPPNTSMPDSTSYGGASDPYREPVDDQS